MALAIGVNTSFLDGLYKTKQRMGTYIQWPAIRQAARFVRRYGPSGHHKGSRFFSGQLIDLAMCSHRMP